MSDRRKIFIYLEQKNHEMTSASQGLLRMARRLGERFDCSLHTVAFGPISTPHSADTFFDIREAADPDEFPSFRSRIISELVREHYPILILFPATAESHDLAACVAAAIGAGFAPRCTAIRADADGFIGAVREVYGGRLSQILKLTDNRTTVVSILPESLPDCGAVYCNKSKETILINANLTEKDKLIQRIASIAEEAEEMDITEADVIISGGRGLKKKENFSLLRELAGRLGGAVAGTRGAVDLEWIERDRQVGQTGKTVAPELYLGCGLSGAPQHLQGMKNSRRIVAINIDPHAPIHRIADFAVIGDLFKIIPAMIEKCENRQS